MADVGTGTTIVFGTSGFTADVEEVSNDGIERAVIEASKFSTTGAMEKIFGDLYDAGSVTMTFHFDPDSQPPISGAVETVTITFPLPAGGTTPADVSGTAAVTAWEYTVPLEDKMTAEATITWDGGTGPTWTAST